jgi:hypothetical protein
VRRGMINKRTVWEESNGARRVQSEFRRRAMREVQKRLGTLMSQTSSATIP